MVKLEAKHYEMVDKLAYRFAYSMDSIKYEELKSIGYEALDIASKTFNESKGAKFETYLHTCVRNKMCTADGRMDKRKDTMQQDENVVIENIDTKVIEMVDDDMESVAKRIIINANKGNERNAEMFMLHIGLTCDKPMDYKELGRKFNVSTERVRQVCVNTQKTIKANKNTTELLYSFVG